MNVEEGLTEIRERLKDNGANATTLKLVDAIRQRAALPAAASASAGSHLQLVRMLMRSPVASGDPAVYNDLSRLEQELEERAGQTRARIEAEEAKPIPKLKKYYKQQKKG